MRTWFLSVCVDWCNFDQTIYPHLQNSTIQSLILSPKERVLIVEKSGAAVMTDYLEAVKGKLLEKEMKRGVVAIIGMGDLGKTTLAKKIYEDSNV